MLPSERTRVPCAALVRAAAMCRALREKAFYPELAPDRVSLYDARANFSVEPVERLTCRNATPAAPDATGGPRAMTALSADRTRARP